MCTLGMAILPWGHKGTPLPRLNLLVHRAHTPRTPPHWVCQPGCECLVGSVKDKEESYVMMAATFDVFTHMFLKI